MGIRKSDIELFNKILASKNLKPNGLRMVQFGDMDLREQEGRGSTYFRKMGMEVLNLDICGQNDSIPVDLSQNIRWAMFKEYFDICTNYGTLEHVKDDLIGYRNADYFLKHGGLMFNIAPVQDIGYKYHRNCHKYNLQWYVDWAKTNDYTILVNEIVNRGKDPWLSNVMEKK